MLTPKQQRFVEEYLIDLNATQAAVRAGYSPANADSIGYQLLRKTPVSNAISAAIKARSERTRVDADWVLMRLVAEVEADLADLFDPDSGEVLPVSDWPPVWRSGLVAGLTVSGSTSRSYVSKLGLSDRLRRLELIGRHVGVRAFESRLGESGLDRLGERLDRLAGSSPCKGKLEDGDTPS